MESTVELEEDELADEDWLAEFWGRVGRGGAEDTDGLLLPAPATLIALIAPVADCSTASPLGEVIPLSFPELVKLFGLDPRRLELFPFLGLVGAAAEWTEAVESIFFVVGGGCVAGGQR